MVNLLPNGNREPKSKRLSWIKKTASIAVAWLILSCTSVERGEQIEAQQWDSIFRLLKNHNITPNEKNINLFMELNKLDGTVIIAGKEYVLPKVDTALVVEIPSVAENTPEKIPTSKWFNFHEWIKTIEVVDNMLKDQTFVIDPGHWWVDSWAHGEVKLRNSKTVEVWEGEIAYDIALRLCKELRSHGADVHITRYNTKIWIVWWTLPNSDVYSTDHWGNRKKDVDGMNSKDNLFINDIPWDKEMSQKKRLAKRVNISNKAQKNKKGECTYISIHLDAWDTFSILYKDSESKEFAKSLVDNGFVWNVKNSQWVKTTAKIPKIKKRNLQILRGNKADQEILIELCDITKDESWKVREEGNRQWWVDDLTGALIKHFN